MKVPVPVREPSPARSSTYSPKSRTAMRTLLLAWNNRAWALVPSMESMRAGPVFVTQEGSVRWCLISANAMVLTMPFVASVRQPVYQLFLCQHQRRSCSSLPLSHDVEEG